MKISELTRSARVVAFAASAMLMAAACSRAPSPDAYGEPPPPPPGPNAELLGEGPPPPVYTPDDRSAYADRGPPPAYVEAPPPPAYAYPPAPPRAPVVIAMEPIPNPPEKPRRARSERRTDRVYTRSSESRAAAPPVRRAKPKAQAQAPAQPRKAEAPRKPPVVAQTRPAAPAKPAPVKAAPAKPIPPKVATAPSAKPAAPKPTPKVATAPVARPAPAAPAPKIAEPPKPPVVAKAPPPPAVAPAAKPPALSKPVLAKPATAPPLTAPQDRATKLAGLQTVLTAELAKAAKFQAPERFTAGAPAEVTLEIPAEFSDVVMAEAEKSGLSDVAGSVNLTSVLSGDGFSVTPAEMAAQPLTPGQPTRFTWQVTAMRGAKGPLHADMGADLAGAGAESLDLGSLKVADGLGGLSPRILGAGLLVLIAALVVGWLAKGRKAPPAKRPEASRPPPPAPEPKPAPTPAPEPAHADTMAYPEAPPANDPDRK